MIEELLEQLKNDTQVRQALSELRKEIKDITKKRSLQYKIGNQPDLFTEFLKHEDPKVRKNAALLLGDLGINHAVDALYECYTKEDKMFIKSAYLNAIGRLDCSKLKYELKKRQDTLLKEKVTVENKKHIMEELRELAIILNQFEEANVHTFTGYEEMSDLVLLTNRNYQEATMKQLDKKEVKEFNAGVLLRTNDLSEVLKIRTYHELLFMIPGMTTCKANAQEAACVIAKSKLLEFLQKTHREKEPFYFRVEVKSKLPLDKKSEFAKKLSQEIELQTKRKLRNDTSNYEVEIRLIQNKEGDFNLLLKLYTLKDERFSYRKDVIASSIKPVNAALVVELSKDYLKEDASILDPFCGVGTMLIERHKKVKANTMYGIDSLEDAIIKARNNTKEAKQIIHYVNRDFFDFTHEYQFDEVITNMPFQWGRVTQEEIDELYTKFFLKIKKHLKEDSTLVLYSHDKELALQQAKRQGFILKENFEISKKEGTYVLVFKYNV